MSIFTCNEQGEDAYLITVDAWSPMAAAEDWVTVAQSRGAEQSTSYDVLVCDELDRFYVVTVTWLSHPPEWAECLSEGGSWRATAWRRAP
jgi:hypothetical protein